MGKRKLVDADVSGQVSIDGYVGKTTQQKNQAELFEMVTILHRDNRKELRKVYGDPDGYWVGEFRYDVWFRDFEGERFVIMSAPVKGTLYEMKGDFNRMNSKSEAIDHFLDYTYRQLKANMPAKFMKMLKDIVNHK